MAQLARDDIIMCNNSSGSLISCHVIRDYYLQGGGVHPTKTPLPEEDKRCAKVCGGVPHTNQPGGATDP